MKKKVKKIKSPRKGVRRDSGRKDERPCRDCRETCAYFCHGCGFLESLAVSGPPVVSGQRNEAQILLRCPLPKYFLFIAIRQYSPS